MLTRRIPLKSRTPLKRGGRLRPVSKKRIKLNKIYSALRLRFLQDHPYCQHFIAENNLDEKYVILCNGWAYIGCTRAYLIKVPRSVEIHHTKGRGRYYLDASTWMAVRANHSSFIHGKPKEAYAKGYMKPRR